MELRYKTAAHELKRLLILIGEPALANGVHSLRRGGSTAVASDDAGGSLTAGFMRQKGKVERAAMAIGRAYRDTGPVAVRPGPVRVPAAGSE